jgi:hypothetical protein
VCESKITETYVIKNQANSLSLWRSVFVVVAQAAQIKHLKLSSFREAQKCRVEKNANFFFPPIDLLNLVQFLRFRVAITFFFGIATFLYQTKIPMDHMIHWRQFCAFLNRHALRKQIS